MTQSFTLKDGMPITPLEYEAFNGQLELICRTCRKQARYDVGRIFIDPPAMQRAARGEAAYEEAVFFSGYFRCKKCGLGGPWDLSDFTKTRLKLLLVMTLEGKAPLTINFGQLRLFDGTPCHSAAEGEAHLQRLIEAKPADYFLWSRLGNLFNVAEEPERALPAFQKAVQLNPHDVESHHSLAEIYRSRGQWQLAADHYHPVLRHARQAPARTREKPGLMKNLVRHTLECVLELHEKTAGEIEVFPPPSSVAPPNPEADEEVVIVLKNYDLSSERGWEELTQSFLEDPRPDNRPRKPRTPAYRFPMEPVKTHVGRNDPCPCGSGKKWKKCCGR